MRKKILILGKTPPPIGGVTIHINRLLYSLNKRKKFQNNFEFYDLSKFNFFSLIYLIGKFDIIHNHSNNRLFQLFVAIICSFLQKQLIITIHGNIGSVGGRHSWFEKLAIRICRYPIVLNNTSYLKAKSLNRNTRMISSFIPPQEIELKLSYKIRVNIEDLKRQNFIFCTNATNFVFDKDGNEIYGIKILYDIFSKLSNCALIISDPSGEYGKRGYKSNDNIYVISETHNFAAVLSICDAFIRNTSTDGDSLSIKEALFLNKRVYASNVVSRPNSVRTFKYNEPTEIRDLIEDAYSDRNMLNDYKFTENSIIDFYSSIYDS